MLTRKQANPVMKKVSWLVPTKKECNFYLYLQKVKLTSKY
jgi:hypothetical protein